MNWEHNAEDNTFPFSLEGLDPKDPSIYRMGITQETAENFGIGVFSGEGPLRNHLVIPIRNSQGETVAYAGRPVDSTDGREVIVPSLFDRSSELFNLHRALTCQSPEVVVVEEILDSLAVYQAGFTCVVALMGNSMSLAQEISLVENFGRVVLMLDGDDEGWRASQDCIRRLATQAFVRAVVLPSGGQPKLLTQEEIRTILTV